MLTDDPGTVHQGNWEINTSINTQISKFHEFEFPLIDINYGYNKRTQLKFEMPYVFSNKASSKLTRTTGNPLLGIKFRFIGGDSGFVSVAAYPQVSIALHKNERSEWKFPIEVEKKIGKFVFGDEIGLLNQESGNFSFDGFLAGLKFTDRFEIMGEIYFIATASSLHLDHTMLNLGMRYELNAKIAALCSLGTEVQHAEKEERKIFFSFTGIQWAF